MRCRNYVTYRNPDTGEEHKDIVWFGAIPYKKVGDVVSNLKYDNYMEKQNALVASLTEKLSVLKGELWNNLGFGIPLLDNYRSGSSIDAEIINIINSNADVVRILEFKSSLNKHNYTCSIKILSKYGEITINL